MTLLYAIGAGLTGGGNDGGAHALSKGLTGYAGLAELARETGLNVATVRSVARLDDPGLLVLTPPAGADGKEIEGIVAARRAIGPTMVVAPKWLTVPAGNSGKPGWVALADTVLPRWEGFADDVTVEIVEARTWRYKVLSGRLPQRHRVEIGTGKDLIALVSDDRGRTLAGYRGDEGYYPRLNAMAGVDVDMGGERTELHPLILVFEPDLLDNQGLRDRATAMLALHLLREASDGGRLPIAFDVTLNGLGRARNLLTLAFTPPFLAATLALLLAALAAGWRGFIRFGPPRVAARAIAYGKTALVENSAGLIRRAGRIRLLGAPYAALVTQRTLRALGLPPGSDAAAIDAAQRRRGQAGAAFSTEAAALAAARKPTDLVRHAAALHTIEKGLSR
ncbi:DUF4350 domain-containing protein [Novosphingobium sp. Gsoil 351]|uniref:DUF4350 domain-containing protein n=1 Tax=Novosphingobium sp. Gsoil 351 TaxID=2675225 RepID=UPI001E2CC2CD|nr:DUF4350 domain-containing protein [Novosphingobium sp. Gsoil 351]